MVIDELKRLQAAHGYLSRAALEALSAERRVPLDELYGVASFYPLFRFAPRTGPELKVCRDLPCRLAGAPRLLADCEAAAARLGGRVSVGTVSCLGLCDRAPAVAIDDAVYTPADPEGGGALVEALAAG
ncbi:MAG TPA: NAD(P)H-dependent oxidoreductase subunit E, partial [Thermodesulfobacteriota bacterium]|nr:NAD(P)H-dependent oxidoreductase subunit E [Thermodesulfobacteriota bacterium]